MSEENKTASDILADMQLTLAQRLLARIQSGDATAADFNVARALLKDNGITASSSANPALPALRMALPEFDEDERAVG